MRCHRFIVVPMMPLRVSSSRTGTRFLFSQGLRTFSSLSFRTLSTGRPRFLADLGGLILDLLPGLPVLGLEQVHLVLRDRSGVPGPDDSWTIPGGNSPPLWWRLCRAQGSQVAISASRRTLAPRGSVDTLWPTSASSGA